MTDGKYADKTNAIRLKHSETEKSQRNKINERLVFNFLISVIVDSKSTIRCE